MTAIWLLPPLFDHEVSGTRQCQKPTDLVGGCGVGWTSTVMPDQASSDQSTKRLHMRPMRMAVAHHTIDSGAHLDQVKGATPQNEMPVMPPLKLLRFSAVHERTGLSRSTIWRLEHRGQFPKHRPISTNAVAWVEGEVAAWIQAKVDVAL